VLVACACALVVAGAAGATGRAPAPEVVVDGVQAGTFSAVVQWHVSGAARVVVAYGRTGTDAQVWSTPVTLGGPGSGTTRLSALEPASRYAFHVFAISAGARGSADGSVLTAPLPPGVWGRTIPDALVVNGQRLFPRMVYRQCPYAYPGSIVAGINLFMGATCTTPAGQLALLSGKALSLTPIASRSTGGPDLLGWYQLDEADIRVDRADALPLVPPSAETGRVPFLTLTSHFFSGAAPLPTGNTIYPELIDRAEMVGFDLYPLQGWCQKDALGAVFDAQAQLVALAAGKPTYQWIEAGPMHTCFGLDPSAAIVQAETWLAIAGGARGIGYFPDQWRQDVTTQITQTDREIASLAPALLDSPGSASVAAPSPVRVGVRTHDGATYVIAVNPTFAHTRARISVRGLGTVGLRLYGDGRWIVANGGVFTDTFGGLQVKIYVAPPPQLS